MPGVRQAVVAENGMSVGAVEQPNHLVLYFALLAFVEVSERFQIHLVVYLIWNAAPVWDASNR